MHVQALAAALDSPPHNRRPSLGGCTCSGRPSALAHPRFCPVIHICAELLHIAYSHNVTRASPPISATLTHAAQCALSSMHRILPLLALQQVRCKSMQTSASVL